MSRYEDGLRRRSRPGRPSARAMDVMWSTNCGRSTASRCRVSNDRRGRATSACPRWCADRTASVTLATSPCRAVRRWPAGRPAPMVDDMTSGRANVQNGCAHAKNVVDLARVHDAHEPIAHGHDVKVSGRQRAVQPCPRLVGTLPHIVQLVPADELAYVGGSAAPTDETERGVRFRPELTRRVEEGVQRVAGAMGSRHTITTNRSSR